MDRVSPVVVEVLNLCCHTKVWDDPVDMTKCSKFMYSDRCLLYHMTDKVTCMLFRSLWSLHSSHQRLQILQVPSTHSIHPQTRNFELEQHSLKHMAPVFCRVRQD